MSAASGRSDKEARSTRFLTDKAADNLRFSRWLAAMHLGALAALVALVVTSLLWISDRHNALARESADKMVQASIRTFAQKMEIVVRDYSIWDEVIEAIAARDTGWLHNNLGSAAAEIGTFDLLYLHDPVSGWSAGWEWGTPVAGTTGLVPPDIKAQLEARLATTDPKRYPVVTGFAESNGDIWGFAMTRVVPTVELDPSVPEGAYARQIHGMILSEARLDTIGDAILIEDLRLTREIPEDKDVAALPGLGAEPAAYLAWAPPTPGARILGQVAMPLGLALLVVVGIALVSSQFAVRSARRLEGALADARAADRAKSEFLSNISHELRTPMNGVIGIAQLLRMTPLNEEQSDLVRILQASADTQMALIGDLLDVVQLESGQRQLSRAPLVPADVAGNVVDLLRPAAEEKGLTLTVTCAPAAQSPVMGDARAITQILTNLLGNAVKFTASGTVQLRLGAEPRGEEMDLRIAVRDTGPGIEEAHQARIFERFAQADTAPLSRAVDGIGLGLAISQTLAERMGGRIVLHSQPGAGSTFTLIVRLPRAEQQTPAIAEVS